MPKMVDCKECIWESDCRAHLAGIAACPVGKRKPGAWELPEAALKSTVITGTGGKAYVWPLDQVEAYRAAYGR